MSLAARKNTICILAALVVLCLGSAAPPTPAMLPANGPQVVADLPPGPAPDGYRLRATAAALAALFGLAVVTAGA